MGVIMGVMRTNKGSGPADDPAAVPQEVRELARKYGYRRGEVSSEEA
jgi:hypothetical protein